MKENNQEIQDSEHISRRTFLQISATTGGAAFFAAGLQPFSFERATALLADLAIETCANPASGLERCALGIGNTYYVKGDSGVDDEEHGTEDSPFASITYAVKKLEPGVEPPKEHRDRLQPGDTVLVKEVKDKDGNDVSYHEQVIIAASGTELAPIVIGAYPGHRPVIDGKAPDWGDAGGLPTGANLPKSGSLYKERHFTYDSLVLIDGDYVVFEGFQIARSMGRGITVNKSNYVAIRHCAISHCRHVGLRLEQNNGVRIESCDISRSGEFYAEDRDRSVQNWPGALSVTGNRDLAIFRTKVHENWGEGVLVDAHADSPEHYTKDVVIRESEFYDNMRASIYLHGVNTVHVEGNLVYHSSDPEFPNPGGIVLRGTEDHARFDKRFAVQKVNVVNNVIVGCRENLTFQKSPRKTKEIRMLFNTLVDGVLAGIRADSDVKFEDCHLQSNLIYQSDPSIPMMKGDFPGWTYAQNFWSSMPSGLDTDPIFVGDPQLMNPGHDRPRGEIDPAWYTLQAGSPIVARTGALESTEVLASGQVAADYFGNRRKTEPSMGAHEYRVRLRSWSRWAPFHSRSQFFRQFAVGANQDGRLEVFGVASNGSPWHTWQRSNGGWSSWVHFHAKEQRFKSFSVGANRDGRLEVFGVAADNSIWHTWQEAANDGWSPWQRFYQQSDKFVSLYIGVNQDDRLEVFGLAEDGTMWQTWQNARLKPVGELWNGHWYYLYGPDDKFVNLAAGTNDYEGLEVFGVKSNGTIWHTRQYLPNRPPWRGWEPFQPESNLRWQNVSLGTNQDGRLEVFGVANNGTPWHSRQREVGWSEWVPFHPRDRRPFHPRDRRFKKLFAAANMDTRLEVFGVAKDNSLWQTYQTEPNGGWSKWKRLHGRYDKFVHLTVGANQNAGLEVFAIRRNFKPRHTWQRT